MMITRKPQSDGPNAHIMALNDDITAHIYHKIQDIPRVSWDKYATPHSTAMSWPFWQVLEQAELNDFRYHYAVLVNAAQEVLAQVCFYDVTTDLAIFAPRFLRRVLGGIRRIWPGFMKLRMLECGTPITLVSPPVTLASGADPSVVIKALTTVLHKIARQQGQLLIVVRDFEPEAAALEPAFTQQGYHLSQNLPNTYLNIIWSTPQAYMASMRSYYRSKLRKYLKRNEEAGITYRLTDSFAEMAETLHAQWMNVHENAKEFQREILTPAFYRNLAEAPGIDARVLLFYRHQQLVGHALLMMDGDMLRWLYVGRQSAEPDGLYLFIAQKVVETAILLGAKKLEMGLTTYPIKQDLGAQIVPLRMALRATNGFVNLFVGLGYKLLNNVPEPQQRQIFKQQGGHE